MVRPRSSRLPIPGIVALFAIAAPGAAALAHTVRVTVVDHHDRPIHHALVSLFHAPDDDHERPIAEKETDDHGRVIFKHLEDGDYTIVVKHEGRKARFNDVHVDGNSRITLELRHED